MINSPGGMPPTTAAQSVAARQTQQGGNWFYWIAALSAINAVLLLTHSPVSLMFGLGATDAVTAIGSGIGGAGLAVALAVTAVLAGVIALFGVFASRGARWAFVAGMAVYALDGLLSLSFKQYLEAAVHAYALFRIFQGFQAAGQLAALRAQEIAAIPPGTTPGVWPPPPSL